MNVKHKIASYTLLLGVRRRRGKRLDAERRRCDAALADARAAEARAADELARRERTRDDYAARLAARTASGSAVRVEDLQGARAHHERIARLCDDAKQALAGASASVSTAENACRDVRQRIVQNDERARRLGEECDVERRKLARLQEQRVEEETQETAAFSAFASGGISARR